jgi:porin
VGIGGTGLIPGRSRDNWGIGYYYDTPSPDLKESLPLLTIRDEQGVEIFYNFAVTPSFTVGVDLQVINPSLGEDTAILPGIRSVLRF